MDKHGGSAMDEYLDRLTELLDRFRHTQREALNRAADGLAERLQHGAVVHLFGTGHSHMIAEEIFYRAGGLVPVNAMLDASIVLSGGAMLSTETERTSGAAAQIAAQYDLRRGDIGVVISHSGRNPAPVEMAQLMREKGLIVIAVTSVSHSTQLPPKDPPGVRLIDVANVVLDTGGAYGDAEFMLEGVLHPVGPTSTVVGAAIVQSLVVATMERLVAAGVHVVNLPSGNVAAGDLLPVLAEMEKYRGRIRHL